MVTSRAIALAILLAPALALADWPKTLDTDCRCERALPGKVVVSTAASPWPKLAWHRSEARLSAGEWYAVSYVAFDADVPASAFNDAVKQLVGAKGVLVSEHAVKGQVDATIKRADGTSIAIRIVAQGRRIYALEAGDTSAGTKTDALFAGFHAWTDKDAMPEGTTAGMVGEVSGIGGSDAAPPTHGTVVLGGIKLAAGKLDLDAVGVILKKAVPRTVDCFDNVTKAATFTITLEISRYGNTTPTITGLEGDPAQCMHYVFVNAPVGKPLDDNPATLVINASYKPPAAKRN
jgi:hypothetical protein